MAPAPYHRIVFAGENTEDMYRVGSTLVTGATLPLGLGLAGDVYVVIAKITGSFAIGSLASGSGFRAAGRALVHIPNRCGTTQQVASIREPGTLSARHLQPFPSIGV